MSAAVRFVPHYTVEDYRLWKGDWELWDGMAIAMSPSPFGVHQKVASALNYEWMSAIRRFGCHATVLGGLDWIVRDDTVVRPDVMVVCGAGPDRHLLESPAIIAEILSPSTRQNDLIYKRELYAREGVVTYLIIDPDAKTIEHLKLADNGNYQSQPEAARIELTVCDDCRLEFDLASVFI